MSMTDENGNRLLTGYAPKLALTGIGIAVFAILSAAFWFNFFRHGKKFMLPLCIGSTVMLLGFGIRIPMTNDPGSLGIYIVQNMCILLSPCGFLANSYVILPRLATWLDAEDCLFLRSRIIVRLFVWSDVITFILQAQGGGLTAVGGVFAKFGHWIALVGLILASISFAIFTILTIVFGLKLRRKYPNKWSSMCQVRRGSGTHFNVQLGWKEDWRTIYWALLWSAAGIIIRCVFRVAEFSQGYDGKLRTVEFWFYVLDTLPLVLGIAVWAVVWPPQIMEEEREFIGTGGSGLTSGHEMGGVDATSKGSSQSGLLGYQQPQSHQSQVYQPRGYPPQGHQVQGYSRA